MVLDRALADAKESVYVRSVSLAELQARGLTSSLGRYLAGASLAFGTGARQ